MVVFPSCWQENQQMEGRLNGGRNILSLLVNSSFWSKNNKTEKQTCSNTVRSTTTPFWTCESFGDVVKSATRSSGCHWCCSKTVFVCLMMKGNHVVSSQLEFCTIYMSGCGPGLTWDWQSCCLCSGRDLKTDTLGSQGPQGASGGREWLVMENHGPSPSCLHMFGKPSQTQSLFIGSWWCWMFGSWHLCGILT